jgi:hypothetical protein
LEEDVAYDEHPPTYIHYSIERKLTANNKGVAKDTEPLFLRSVLSRILLERASRQKNTAEQVVDTNVAVSVTDRSERDLVKHFDGLDIDWTVIEKQLQIWSHLFCIGKKLRIDISFNYVETGQVTGASVRRGTKPGYSSVSQYVVSERTMQLDVEEEASGQPSIWRHATISCDVPDPLAA